MWAKMLDPSNGLISFQQELHSRFLVLLIDILVPRSGQPQ